MAKRQSRSESVERLTDRAQFVFRGTVIQRGAATLDEVPLTRDTLIVRVDEILDGPPVLSGFSGQEITVQLERGLRAATGKTYVFYTNGWIYGSSLAVKCIGLTEETEADLRATRRAVEAAPERALRERASRAELVVTGRITEVREVPRQPGAPITEHDPEWRQAVIAVESVPHAGSGRARKPKQVTIRFAASPDVRWAKAPKFAVGDAGIWMLGEKQADKELKAMRTAAGATASEFLVVEPEDFLPIQFAPRVQAILDSPKGGAR
jgi:hypothetical protein